MKFLGYLFGLLSGLFWAANGITYENLNTEFPFSTSLPIILSLLFISELTALIITTLFLSKQPRIFLCHNISKINHKTLIAILAGIIGAPIGMFCYLQAIQYIGIGYTAPLSSIYPIIGISLSVIFLKESLSKLSILGLTIALICTIFLSLDLNQSQSSILGFLFVLICALSWGTEIILSSYVMKYISSNNAYCLRQIGASLGYLSLILYFKIDIITFLVYLENSNFLTLISLIILFSMLSYLFYFQAISILKPVKAMILNMTYGFWTVIIHKIKSPNNIYDLNLLLAFGLVLGTIIFFITKEKENL